MTLYKSCSNYFDWWSLVEKHGRQGRVNIVKTTKHRTLIFGMVHHLVAIFHVCSNYGPGTKSDPVLWVKHFTCSCKIFRNVRETTLALVVVFDLPVVIFIGGISKYSVYSFD